MSENRSFYLPSHHPLSAEFRAQRERRFAHAKRCSSLRPLAAGEAEALQAAYLARVGAVTECPPVYLVPTSQV